MNKRIIKISGTISTVIFLLMGYNHCVVQKNLKKKESSTNVESTTNTSNDSPTNEVIGEQVSESPNAIVTQTVDVGVKNYEQILNTMSTLTGVSLDDNNIKRTYEDVKDQLPTSNDIKSFQSANQVAIIKLASEFCNELVNTSALRSSLWPNFNFNGSPRNELDTEGRDYIIENVIDHFWMLSEEEFSTKLNAQSELSSLITDLLVGEDQSAPSVTRRVVNGVCISTLASIHAVML